MSFQPSISHNGIEEAIQGLGYRNESALKSRLVATIRERYGTNGEFKEPSTPIDAEELIRLLWDVDPDPESLRSKKKNLSSIKSSVNSDLKRLYREGKNPEGITIGPENLFTISDEAKDDLLASIRSGGGATLMEIRKVAGILSGILSKDGLSGESFNGMGSDLQQIEKLLKSISEKMGPSGDAGALEKVIDEALEDEVDSGEKEEAAAEPLDLDHTEGEFPEADPDDLVLESADVVSYEDVEIEESDELLDVSEGEVFETDESSEEVEDVGLSEEEIEISVPEAFAEGEAWLEGSPESVAAEGSEEVPAEDLDEALEVEEDLGEIDETPDEAQDDDVVLEADPGEGALSQGEEELGLDGVDEGLSEVPAEDLEEALEVEEDLGEVEETADEYDGSEDEPLETVPEEDVAIQEVEEIPDAAETVEALEEEGVNEEAVDALEVEEDLGGIEEEETPEELDDSLDTAFEAALGESAEAGGGEDGIDPGDENAPVQAVSVGDQAGGTEVADQGKSRLLAEKFNNSLSEMDRFYNQYLLVPAGEYTIGSPDPRETVHPSRRVRITEFYVGKFPVTNALFDVFVEKTGYRTTAERLGYGTVYYGRLQKIPDAKTGRKKIIWNSSLTSKIIQGAFWYQPFGPGSNLHHKRNHPVVQVSLEDAMAFAAWTGKRLPTEEEWEAASRTEKGTLYPWGNRARKNSCNMEESGHGDTTSVDSYIEFENEYGVADTLGNVLEWTTSKSEVEGEQGAVQFIAKGGGWISAKPVTLAGRTELGPESHSNILGFRCIAY